MPAIHNSPLRLEFYERSTSSGMRLDWKAPPAKAEDTFSNIVKVAKKVESGTSDTVGYGWPPGRVLAAIRCLLDAWSPGEVVSSKARYKGKVPLARLLCQGAKGQATLTCYANTGNLPLQGPAAYMEEADANLEELGKVGADMAKNGYDGVPARTVGLVPLIDVLLQKPIPQCPTEPDEEEFQQNMFKVMMKVVR